ncbi:MAG TPA: hypothetical protein VH105_15090 [Burkholderiales bacterium]|jgi:hypothetical protein|nr:hypothetical protein [Burkholderiales bacterium]
MNSRITGGVAVVLGALILYAVAVDKKPLDIKPLLGGIAFVGLGGYYLITGKRAATKREFIMEGKLGFDDEAVKKPDQGAPSEAPVAPVVKGRLRKT